MSDWQEFFSAHGPPNNFESCKSKINSFCVKHNGSKLVLITVRITFYQLIILGSRLAMKHCIIFILFRPIFILYIVLYLYLFSK